MDNTWQPSNRDKKLESKPGLFWCGTCDMKLVSEGAKCKKCGAKAKRKRLKNNLIPKE